MDLQFPVTPPKNKICHAEDFSTPVKSKNSGNCYDTPQKKSAWKQPQKAFLSTPVRGQNPQSKKQKIKSRHTAYNHLKTPQSSHKKKITQFSLSRLDQDYQFVKNLGQGNFSRVGLYKSHMTGQLFAIKITRLSSMSINEAQALGTLSIFNSKSKNLVRYFYSWVEDGQLYIVMEHCSHTLTSYFNQKKKKAQHISQNILKQILKQALRGLKCMHQNKMVHLDIKPDNLLFSKTSKSESDFTLKISDLGLTRISKLKRESDLDEGDSRYLAKQVLNYTQNVDLTKSDIFSLGMTMYEGLIMKKLPNNGQQWQKIRNNGLNLKDSMDLHDYSSQFLEIIQMMARSKFNERPSAQFLLKLPYFGEDHEKKFDFRENRFFRKMPEIKNHSLNRKKQASL